MKYKKREQPRGPQAPRSKYRHGVRVDDPNYPALVHSASGDKRPSGKRGKPPMDPRYPPARYAGAENYAYAGPGMVLPAHARAPLILQKNVERKTFLEEWPHIWKYLIIAAICIAISVTIIMVILYVFGDLTNGRSPVYKGHFG